MVQMFDLPDDDETAGGANIAMDTEDFAVKEERFYFCRLTARMSYDLPYTGVRPNIICL